MFYRIAKIMQSIPHVHFEYEEYFVDYCQSHEKKFMDPNNFMV